MINKRSHLLRANSMPATVRGTYRCLSFNPHSNLCSMSLCTQSCVYLSGVFSGQAHEWLTEHTYTQVCGLTPHLGT